MRSRILATNLIFLFAVGYWCDSARGQHDPHRNAVRHAAASRWNRFDTELQKANADDPETHFVRFLGSLLRDQIDQAEKHAKAAADAGLPWERIVTASRLSRKFRETEFFRDGLQRHPITLLHGPMLGAVSDRSASVWLRTARPAEVQCVVLDENGSEVARSLPVETSEESDRVGVLNVTGLKANRAYGYRIEIDGKRHESSSWGLRTYPTQHAAGRFAVGIGGGAGYVPKWEYAWTTIRKQQPHAFLMLGDNVYIDDPTHRLTSDYCYHRRQARPEWRAFTASTSMYAIYDDHDFGDNDCVPGPLIEEPAWKRKVWEQFRSQWANPAYGGGKEQPGCWFDFYIGDVHFILLDGRYYRTRGAKPSMLGPVQNAWLRKTLLASRGVFKVLASPVPWSEGVKPKSKDPWDGFPEEREAIFSFLEERRIEGVVLVAADRHRTDLRVTRREACYPLYEFESSKLTNRHTHPVVKTDGLIWGYNKTCSFGLMHFDTTLADPSVTFEARNIDGGIVHTHVLRRSRLTFPR